MPFVVSDVPGYNSSQSYWLGNSGEPKFFRSFRIASATYLMKMIEAQWAGADAAIAARITSQAIASGDYVRNTHNGRASTSGIWVTAQTTLDPEPGNTTAVAAIVLYVNALASPAGHWGTINYFFSLAGWKKFIAGTPVSDFPNPTEAQVRLTTGSIYASGNYNARFVTPRAVDEIADTVETPEDETDEEEDVVEEVVPEVPESSGPSLPVVMVPPSNVPNDAGGNLVSVVISDSLGGGTPVVLPALRGSTGLVRFVQTLPGFSARVGVPNGLTFTKNAVARAAWTVSKAILTSLGLVTIVEAIDDLADDGVLNFLLGGGAGEYDVGDTIGNASVTKTWEANGVPFIALSDGRLGARKSTGTWRFWRPRRPIVLYSDGAKDLKTGIRAGKALIKQAREMRKLSNALLGTQKEKRRSAPPHQHHEVGTSIRNIEVT